MSARVEQYVRHARRFGDPRAVFETAFEERLTEGFSYADLGYLAAQLRRLDLKREANQVRSGHRRDRWPQFELTKREKRRLAIGLLEEQVPVKTICTYCQTTPGWVEDLKSDLAAEAKCVELLGNRSVDGVGPVDLLDSGTSPRLYEALTAALGHRSSSVPQAPDRLSASGIVAVGLRFERLEVVRIERDHSGRRIAVCRCDCGTETTAKPSHLLRGEKRSCGCLRRERMASLGRKQVSAR